MKVSQMLIGIDWGGTKIEGVAMLPDDAELVRLREPTPRHDYSGCISVIKSMVGALEEKTGQTGSLGIGIPGSLEPQSGRGKGASSTWLLGRSVFKDLQAALQRDIKVENDADCFAASEAVDGAGTGHNVVFAVILGSGAGAGIAVNGNAHHGPNNSGGEWGHNPLPWMDPMEFPGPACYCGRNGCIEQFVSGQALAADHQLVEAENLEPATIAARAAHGDGACARTLERYFGRLGRALAHVINLIDPDVIVVGGGLSRIGGIFDAVPRIWPRFVYTEQPVTKLVRAAHGDSSGVRGAARLWDATAG